MRPLCEAILTPSGPLDFLFLVSVLHKFSFLFPSAVCLDALTHQLGQCVLTYLRMCPRLIQSEKPNSIGRVGNPISLYSPLNYGSNTELIG